ncbi:replication factor C subunit [Cavenderia fasciculata]|uniref:Replication factor C subunit n=1 Tax=Cavenderia fasciculata TaxID=261658 RepID=F4PL06_CACFS|nr:replication factor C subunit [Cavenderia fasciculata]EGG23228.1 replication factor C subunit [Cavenderia fasciculata]|eukprot:XP_004361079.1 replication factor C subunit [Cavenderia fasciculata]
MDMDEEYLRKQTKEQRIHDSLPWVEKYRPKSLKELISHEDIIDTITKLIDKNSLPHLLFYGPPGTGKTSTIQAVARKLYGDNYSRMVLELNASDDRGIDVVREQIKSFAGSMGIFNTNQFKLIILDEADSMTNAAQTALRRVIETYTKTTRFCMICNYVGKLIPALQSRCTRFRFGRLGKPQSIKRIKEIVEQEKYDIIMTDKLPINIFQTHTDCPPIHSNVMFRMNISDEAITSIELLAEGDMRKSLNLLQSVSMSSDDGVQITDADIYRCAGVPSKRETVQILQWCIGEDFDEAYKNLSNMKKEKGFSLVDIIKDVSVLIHKARNMDERAITSISKELAEIEYNLSFGASEKLQLGYFVGAFQSAR